MQILFWLPKVGFSLLTGVVVTNQWPDIDKLYVFNSEKFNKLIRLVVHSLGYEISLFRMVCKYFFDPLYILTHFYYKNYTPQKCTKALLQWPKDSTFSMSMTEIPTKRSKCQPNFSSICTRCIILHHFRLLMLNSCLKLVKY